MEIINTKVATLSNFEVMNHLQNVKEGKKRNKGQLATITYETLRYLESTPCKHQTPESIENCLKALKHYNLTKNEKLMLINTPPITPLEIQLMVEESEERLTEEQVEEILQIITEHFPHVRKIEAEVEEEVEGT
ncbi:DNA-directed RNA polymerase III subunit RPC9 [Agrilus planipennis]|uniref:DNA-directed RNA polymerase III subunit RPC9 n=1 Tax=Agrilus planipennis TaxID=224129 RepID=A0A1W4W4D5_AGRPL|nr:DNA-directed RNA polymerase III subunit RPC9 [Agrilus planipennis]